VNEDWMTELEVRAGEELERKIERYARLRLDPSAAGLVMTAQPAVPARVPTAMSPVEPAGTSADPATKRIEEQLRKHLQTDVHVQTLGNERGVVRISFYSADDLERLLDLVLGPVRSDFD